MARKQNKDEQQADTAIAESGLGQAGKDVSKSEAVRLALRKFGRDAKPSQIRDYVLSEYGLDMSLNHISNIKSNFNKKRRGRKPGSGRKARAEAAAETQGENGRSARAVSVRSGGFSLDDIKAAKELAQRIGVAQLHTLIDLFAR